MTRVFIGRATDLDIHREMLQTQGDDRPRKTEAEMGVIRLQAKDQHGCPEPPEARRGKEGDSPRAF